MAKTTVQAVRQAEKNAVGLEKEAALKRDTIIEQARTDAKVLLSTVSKEAQVKAVQDLEQAQAQGIEIMEKAKVRAGNEILLLKEMVKDKEHVAIDLVLSLVI